MDTQEIQDLATGWRRGKLSRAELLRRLAIGGLTLSGALALLEEEVAAAENRSYWERVGGRFNGQTLVVTSYGGTWQDFLLSDHLPDFERKTGA
jgi:hypothetical protein